MHLKTWARRKRIFPSLLRLPALLLMSSIVLASCGEGVTDVDDIGGGGSADGSNWSRNDGQNAYLQFSGTVAKACSNNTETIGTFNATAPSMTFVVAGDPHTFPLQFSGNQLLVGVPDQGIDTHNATQYVKVNEYPCGGGDEGGNQSNTPAIGTIKVRVHRPSGVCESSSTYGSGRAFMGTMGGQVYDAQGNPSHMYFPVSSSSPAPSNSSTAAYWDYTFTNVNKITWQLWPNRSSWPTSCNRTGEATVDVNGQTKEIVINW